MMRWGWLLLWIPLVGWAAEEEELFDRVSLQAAASDEVENDRMLAQLAVKAEDSDPARLADTINRAMRWALERAGKVPAVEAKTTGYWTRPVYRKERLSHWQGEQTLLLESGDFAALGILVGDLQSRLTLQSMNFTVSEGLRRETENRLMDEALNAFKSRAARVNKNLDGGGWRIVHLDIATGAAGPGPMLYRAEATMAAPPATAAGRSEVTVTVNGTVQLLPGSATGR